MYFLMFCCRGARNWVVFLGTSFKKALDSFSWEDFESDFDPNVYVCMYVCACVNIGYPAPCQFVRQTPQIPAVVPILRIAITCFDTRIPNGQTYTVQLLHLWYHPIA